MLQCLIFIPYMIKAPEHEQDAKQVIWRLMDLVIFAAPPGLPLVLMLVGAVARDLLLKKDGLLLLSPQILKQGADVDVVCFDKTGTLTDSLVSAATAFEPFTQHISRDCKLCCSMWFTTWPSAVHSVLPAVSAHDDSCCYASSY